MLQKQKMEMQKSFRQKAMYNVDGWCCSLSYKYLSVMCSHFSDVYLKFFVTTVLCKFENILKYLQIWKKG